MKLELKDLPAKLKPLLAKLNEYAVFVFIIVSLLCMSYLVFRINQLSKLEPSDTALTEKLQTTPRPRVDEDLVRNIEKLRDESVQVQTLFEQARDNPFSE